MTRQDIEGLMASLPEPLRFLRDGMAGRLVESFKHAHNLRLFAFGVAGSQMTADVYDYFRDTDWLILSVPERQLGEGMQRASLWAKRYVDPSPARCFHATPAGNRASIDRLGILPGFRVGKQGRGQIFADSKYYIYASLTAKDAADWCKRFEPGMYLVYPIDLQKGTRSGRLFVDPMSENDNTLEAVGYILETAQVPTDSLGVPMEFEVGVIH